MSGMDGRVEKNSSLSIAFECGYGRKVKVCCVSRKILRKLGRIFGYCFRSRGEDIGLIDS